eukprot:TRINITY_DN2145_c0_g1_i3.p1 TRINITY_DN2145_c0_g1~~TRINITY_DN2145_c0_g1_i3.p1  ORF type:complete len:456 (-),score=103.87 TRINITY_DN2145_c0_g1_i3:26-1393(-)
MSDGASRVLELYSDTVQDPKLREELNYAYTKLTSRTDSWTSGQWMTEKTGGSDVSRTETIATLNDDGSYALSGYKYFTSATKSNIAITLARIINPDGSFRHGSRGLSLFFIKLRDEDGNLDQITVHKLKEKLGTRSVPTAELEMHETRGILIGQPGQGIKLITSMLNITRLYCSMGCLSGCRRGIAVVRDYSARRFASGKYISEHPLHLTTLSTLEITFKGILHFYVDVLLLLGKVENKLATSEEHVLFRVFCPLLKMFSAKKGIEITSECLESLGGTGYMEDSDMPRLLRDIQVNAIWEGTTNVMSLDVLRSIFRNNSLDIYLKHIRKRLSVIKGNSYKEDVDILTNALYAIEQFSQQKRAVLEAYSRSFSFSLTNIYISLLLLEHSILRRNGIDLAVARRWIRNPQLVEIPNVGDDYYGLAVNKYIAMDIDINTRKYRGVGNIDPMGNTRAKY